MRLPAVLPLLLLAASTVAGRAADTPDFIREVRPILAAHCFNCHGFDAGARKAGLRLDERAAALRPAKSGASAIVPGHPEASELLLRVTDSADPMPPAETGKRLTTGEVDILRRWIAAGAEYRPHWAFTAPARPAEPAVRDVRWVRQPIDRFTLARMEREGLQPSPEADSARLLRRVSLDLTGLPPRPEDLRAFLADAAPGAYERAVDRLLASPAYGERMAVDWLDAARYADSNGYFRDNTRQIWPWRDWVIRAFNRNQPFDQFTIEQLAGDLLPAPTDEQRIATGFNRNHMVTGETGVIDEEYRVEYVADQIETTAAVWMGLTLGCARCHDHKYDPVTQADYYRLFAFFDRSVEKGLVNPDDPPPVMIVASPEEKAHLAALKSAHDAADARLKTLTEILREPAEAWAAGAARALQPPAEKLLTHAALDYDVTETSGPAERPAVSGAFSQDLGVIGKAAVFGGAQHLEFPASLPLEADRAWTLGVWVKPTANLVGVLAKMSADEDRRGVEVIWAKGQLQVNLVHRWVANAIEITTRPALRGSDWRHVVVSYDGSSRAAGVAVYVDGQRQAVQVTRDTLRGPIGNDRPLLLGRRDAGLGYHGLMDEFRLLARALEPAEVRNWYWAERLHDALALEPAKRDARAKQRLLEAYIEREGDPAVRTEQESARRAAEEEAAYRAAIPQTLVMQDAPTPRVTRLLKRGQYDQPGETVTAGVPAWLPPLPAGAPPDRLALARWLVTPEHPLTARVAANRLWQQCFGEGLVTTPADFGTQGQPPSHPELLDWLAVRLVESGWDVKALLRSIVTSATYRQNSAATPELLTRDPENQRLARGPRFRLPGEMLRDQALAVSGLLIERLGGPPVKPFQPPGLWEAVSYNGELSYEPDPGEGRWRRSVYSYWKRTAPPPGIQIFDSPTRETCTLRRPRTNTPLQALLLLNEETQVEAARSLATRVLKEERGAGDTAGLEALFLRVTQRRPDPVEIGVLVSLLAKLRDRYAAAPAEAARFASVGTAPAGRDLDPRELAPWTAVAQAVLNLDEVVTRR